MQVQYENQQMHITVVDEQTAENLCRMNGFNFGAATVSVLLYKREGTLLAHVTI